MVLESYYDWRIRVQILIGFEIFFKENESVSKIPAETHGDGASDDFGDAGGEDNGGGGIGARETGRESEGNGEAVGDPDDDVTDDLSGGEVLLLVEVEEALFLRLQVHSVLGVSHICVQFYGLMNWKRLLSLTLWVYQFIWEDAIR